MDCDRWSHGLLLPDRSAANAKTLSHVDPVRKHLLLGPVYDSGSGARGPGFNSRSSPLSDVSQSTFVVQSAF